MDEITGAFFEGEGEVTTDAPNNVERRSMSLFTGWQFLENTLPPPIFASTMMRRNELRPGLRAADDPKDFTERWGATARNLANPTQPLLMTFSRMLSAKAIQFSAEQATGRREKERSEKGHSEKDGSTVPARALTRSHSGSVRRLLRFDGVRAGTGGATQGSENGDEYYDVWTSFSPSATGAVPRTREGTGAFDGEKPVCGGRVEIRRYNVAVEVNLQKTDSRPGASFKSM